MFYNNETLVQLPDLPVIPWLMYGTTTRKLKFTSDDKVENIKDLKTALGLKPRGVVFSDQIHQSNLVVIDDNSQIQRINFIQGIDGFISTVPKVLLTVFTADCVPVFFADVCQQFVGIAHCGWRGTLQKLTQKMIQQFLLLGSKPIDLLIWTGPAICGNCYEVAPDLTQKFIIEFGTELLSQNIIHQRQLNLPALNRWQAIQLGVPSSNIYLSEYCTRCRQDLFYSYRGEGKNSGRLISFIINMKSP
ncbi:MAG: peptidoglycan editing factor PgeF [Candidatus Sumerlaeia bacterium]|nr:peptidoglycan editing factor PgeF [Candidatus Sumerlaeia bacterium]